MGLSEYLEGKKELVKVEEGQLIIAEQMKNALIMLEHQKQRIESEKKDIETKLREVMTNNNITGYESNDKRIKITLAQDRVSETIDKDKLFKEFPEAYRSCLKKGITKGKLQITTREPKE